MEENFSDCEEESYDYDDFNDWDDSSDGGCGEGFSCSESDNYGCPAH
ncbi:hypothetical protein EZS27_023656, partial [termite gut metagenome]